MAKLIDLKYYPGSTIEISGQSVQIPDLIPVIVQVSPGAEGAGEILMQTYGTPESMEASLRDFEMRRDDQISAYMEHLEQTGKRDDMRFRNMGFAKNAIKRCTGRIKIPKTYRAE